MLRLQQLLQIVWLVVAAPLVWRYSSRAFDISSLIAFVAYGSLGVGTLLLWRRSFSGLVISAGAAAVVGMAVTPWAVRNFWAYLTDHPRYVDSPATILVVGIIAMLTVVPSVIVLVLSAVNQRRLRARSGA